MDTPWHTLFECEAWEQERHRAAEMIESSGGNAAEVISRLAPDTLVPEMLKSRSAWNQVSAFVSTIMRKKMETEWERQRAGR